VHPGVVKVADRVMALRGIGHARVCKRRFRMGPC
jgi:hypothetical protein